MMKAIENLQMTPQMSPETYREHCLLKRRIEWLELSSIYAYRTSADRKRALDERYADVSMDLRGFCDVLGDDKTK